MVVYFEGSAFYPDTVYLQHLSYCHAPVSGVIVGDNHTVAVPATVLRRRRKTVVLDQSNVAFHQLAETPRRHLERVLISPVNRITTGQLQASN